MLQILFEYVKEKVLYFEELHCKGTWVKITCDEEKSLDEPRKTQEEADTK